MVDEFPKSTEPARPAGVVFQDSFTAPRELDITVRVYHSDINAAPILQAFGTWTDPNGKGTHELRYSLDIREGHRQDLADDVYAAKHLSHISTRNVAHGPNGKFVAVPNGRYDIRHTAANQLDHAIRTAIEHVIEHPEFRRWHIGWLRAAADWHCDQGKRHIETKFRLDAIADDQTC